MIKTDDDSNICVRPGARIDFNTISEAQARTLGPMFEELADVSFHSDAVLQARISEAVIHGRNDPAQLADTIATLLNGWSAAFNSLFNHVAATTDKILHDQQAAKDRTKLN